MVTNSVPTLQKTEYHDGYKLNTYITENTLA